jgi:hypothetical protein
MLECPESEFTFTSAIGMSEFTGEISYRSKTSTATGGGRVRAVDAHRFSPRYRETEGVRVRKIEIEPHSSRTEDQGYEARHAELRLSAINRIVEAG